ncbi:MAG: adenylate/guanylate cyclase domain-containing protein [Spirochaetes bacterium]|nr:adenylate/guanylate cyclase domain-containing protein [Spirochaetota bacterium]
MSKHSRGIFFRKVNNTRIIPVRLKIVIIFALFLLISNFTSNYINLMFNRSYQIKLMKDLLAKDLKGIFTFGNTQYDLYKYKNDLDYAHTSIALKAKYEMQNSKAVFASVKTDGNIEIFSSVEALNPKVFEKDVMDEMNKNRENLIEDGFVTFYIGDDEYFGVYKYNTKWNSYYIRAEEYSQFSKPSNEIFFTISWIILVISLICTVVGIFIITYILRFITHITSSIMEMVKGQRLDLIQLKDAPNDDITYLGVAFNSLSSTIDTLLNIFKKFTNQDIAQRVYAERSIKLEGTQRDLTILFTDIKGFTAITETLGTDIIKLINMHYDKAIREIVRYRGSIGSIIGDALLAMFGTMDQVSDVNKSYAAVLAAYELHAVAESLRQQMTKKKNDIIKEKGSLTPDEEKVYNAVLLEIGVGIDGGEVFYGNIGSYVRMTNTVIGDNVNAASRLESLTRIYHVPVICSDYVKEDIELNMYSHNIYFMEIDTVMVKGKSYGKKVYWPIPSHYMTKKLKQQILLYKKALQDYYAGKWPSAYTNFKKCGLPVSEEFIERTKGKKAPKNWKGIWAMKTK